MLLCAAESSSGRQRLSALTGTSCRNPDASDTEYPRTRKPHPDMHRLAFLPPHSWRIVARSSFANSQPVTNPRLQQEKRRCSNRQTSHDGCKVAAVCTRHAHAQANTIQPPIVGESDVAFESSRGNSTPPTTRHGDDDYQTTTREDTTYCELYCFRHHGKTVPTACSHAQQKPRLALL